MKEVIAMNTFKSNGHQSQVKFETASILIDEMVDKRCFIWILFPAADYLPDVFHWQKILF